MQFCHSEVENLHPAIAGYEKVFRLEIAMDDAAIVRRDESLHHLQRVVDRQANR